MEIHEMSATAIVEAYRAKRLSRREVIEAHLARCDAVNPTVKGVIYRFDERALKEADDADRTAEDRAHLPLDGVPITVSEFYAVENCPQPLGMPAFEQNISQTDDILVTRLRDAGAIVIGKTAIPEGFFRWNAVSTLFGETRSARNPSCSAGGSGGGAGTAVAAGIVPIAFHGDAGGSLRVPASWCDVLTMRSSPYVVASDAMPLALTPETFGSPGPLARTWDDVMLALRVVANPHPAHPRTIPFPVFQEQSAAERPRPRVVRLSADALGATTEAEVMREVDRVAAALAELGYEVVDAAAPESMSELGALWAGFTGTSSHGFVQPSFGTALGEQASHFLKTLYGPYLFGDKVAPWIEAEVRLSQIEQEVSLFMDRFPIILAPVSGYRRPPIDFDYDLTESGAREMFDHQRWAVWVNALKLPASALGNGVQIVGRRWHDAQVASVTADVLARLAPITVANPHLG